MLLFAADHATPNAVSPCRLSRQKSEALSHPSLPSFQTETFEEAKLWEGKKKNTEKNTHMLNL